MFKKITAIVAGVMLSGAVLAANVSADTPAVVTASALNIRQYASTSSAVIGVVYSGDHLNVVGSEGEWYKIAYGNNGGYVHGNYISFSRDLTSRSGQNFGYEIVQNAKKYIGVPYQYGGNGPSSFDCSGFTKYVFANLGISLPRTSYSQLNVGVAVSRENLQPGDLVFFRSGGHVGIYVGDNQYIHAPQTGRTVSIDPMNRTLYAARRISR